MTNFIKIDDLPVYDLYTELLKILETGAVTWYNNQISINTIHNNSDDYKIGTGSLYLDWDNSHTVSNDTATGHIVVNPKPVLLKESDFKFIVTHFKGTLFETVYNVLNEKYNLGRVRLIRSNPRACLSWHLDDTTRIHFPIKTQTGCFMVIDDEIKHLPHNTWWHTHTYHTFHTAFNASNEDRIHLVACAIL